MISEFGKKQVLKDLEACWKQDEESYLGYVDYDLAGEFINKYSLILTDILSEKIFRPSR